jgi:hypothetical protein
MPGLLRGPTGKLLRGPGGALTRDTDCCCDEPPPTPDSCADLIDNYLASVTMDRTINSATWSGTCETLYGVRTGITEDGSLYDPTERRHWRHVPTLMEVVIICGEEYLGVESCSGTEVAVISVQWTSFFNSGDGVYWYDCFEWADVVPGETLILPYGGTLGTGHLCTPSNTPTCSIFIDG